MSTKFIIEKSNAHEKTIDILEKHCGRFEGYNPELIEFVKSDDVLNEIVESIQEGLDSLGDRVSFNLSTSDLAAEVDVTVFNLQGDMFQNSHV